MFRQFWSFAVSLYLCTDDNPCFLCHRVRGYRAMILRTISILRGKLFRITRGLYYGILDIGKYAIYRVLHLFADPIDAVFFTRHVALRKFPRFNVYLYIAFDVPQYRKARQSGGRIFFTGLDVVYFGPLSVVRIEMTPEEVLFAYRGGRARLDSKMWIGAIALSLSLSACSVGLGPATPTAVGDDLPGNCVSQSDGLTRCYWTY